MQSETIDIRLKMAVQFHQAEWDQVFSEESATKAK
jgi:hypothetical protein